MKLFDHTFLIAHATNITRKEWGTVYVQLDSREITYEVAVSSSRIEVMLIVKIDGYTFHEGVLTNVEREMWSRLDREASKRESSEFDRATEEVREWVKNL